MHKWLATVLTLLMLGASAGAESVIRFHVKLTDGRTALLANPKLDELRLTNEQVRRAASGRVLLLDRTSGTSWNWLMLSWLENKPDAEHGINTKGVASPGKDADVGLTVIDGRTLKVRCLREDCTLVTTDTNDKEVTVRLVKGEPRQVPIDSFVQITFRPR